MTENITMTDQDKQTVGHFSVQTGVENRAFVLVLDHVCHSYSYGLRAIIQCLPAWLRFIQCLRRYRDTKRAFPHLVNAGKYSTTFFVVTFAALYATHKGRQRGRALCA